MTAEEFRQRAILAALPEAHRSHRKDGPAAVARAAKAQADAAFEVAFPALPMDPEVTTAPSTEPVAKPVPEPIDRPVRTKLASETKRATKTKATKKAR